MDGFICIDKPIGPSSFAVAQSVRKALNVRKAGHAGTLDPMASGLLVVAVGKCTRLLEYLTLEPKDYNFTVTFGASTDTLDAEGVIIATSDVLPPRERIEGVLKDFTGEIEQIPPQYSAIKIGGAPAYKLARKGKDVPMKPRVVNIYSLRMAGYDGGKKSADFAASCSAGTYIRSLGRDIAKAADTGAEMFVSKLRRTRTGRFDLSMAADYGDIKSAKKYFIGAESAFGDAQKVTLSEGLRAEIANGRGIFIDGREPADTLVAFDEAGALLAALRRVEGNRYRPEKVFIDR
jgi:tRNA pseudouridine55 synthase